MVIKISTGEYAFLKKDTKEEDRLTSLTNYKCLNYLKFVMVDL